MEAILGTRDAASSLSESLDARVTDVPNDSSFDITDARVTDVRNGNSFDITDANGEGIGDDTCFLDSHDSDGYESLVEFSSARETQLHAATNETATPTAVTSGASETGSGLDLLPSDVSSAIAEHIPVHLDHEEDLRVHERPGGLFNSRDLHVHVHPSCSRSRPFHFQNNLHGPDAIRRNVAERRQFMEYVLARKRERLARMRRRERERREYVYGGSPSNAGQLDWSELSTGGAMAHTSSSNGSFLNSSIDAIEPGSSMGYGSPNNIRQHQHNLYAGPSMRHTHSSAADFGTLTEAPHFGSRQLNTEPNNTSRSFVGDSEHVHVVQPGVGRSYVRLGSGDSGHSSAHVPVHTPGSTQPARPHSSIGHHSPNSIRQHHHNLYAGPSMRHTHSSAADFSTLTEAPHFGSRQLDAERNNTSRSDSEHIVVVQPGVGRSYVRLGSGDSGHSSAHVPVHTPGSTQPARPHSDYVYAARRGMGTPLSNEGSLGGSSSSISVRGSPSFVELLDNSESESDAVGSGGDSEGVGGGDVNEVIVLDSDDSEDEYVPQVS